MNKKSAIVLVLLLILILLVAGCAERLKGAKGLKKKAIEAAENTPEGKVIGKLSDAFNGAPNCTTEEFKLKAGILGNVAAESGLEIPSTDEEIAKYLEITKACKPEYLPKVFKAKEKGVYEIRVSFNVADGCADESLKSFEVENFLVIEVNTKNGTAKITHGEFDEEAKSELPAVEGAISLAGNCTAQMMLASGLLENAVGDEEATVDASLPEVPEEAVEEDEAALEQQAEEAVPEPKVEEKPKEPATVECKEGMACTVDLSQCTPDKKAASWMSKTSVPGKIVTASYLDKKGMMCQTDIPQAWPVVAEASWWCGTVKCVGEAAPQPVPPQPQPQPVPQPAGPGNTTLTVDRLFPGQYDNTKYMIKVKDPDKIQSLTVSKADGSGIIGGAPPCLEEVPSSTLTLLPSDFPLKATVSDCKDKTITYTVTAVMPPVAGPSQPQPPAPQPQPQLQGCTDNDAGRERADMMPSTCVDKKGTFTNKCTSDFGLMDYTCRTTFESKTVDDLFCVEYPTSCQYGCKDGRCMSTVENPNVCTPSCHPTMQKCVNRTCVYKTCEEVGGKICAAGEQCTSRLIFSGENMGNRTCCENAKCEKIQQATAAEEKSGQVKKQALWTYVDFSAGPAITTSNTANIDLSFYWSVYGAEVSLAFIKTPAKLGRAGNDWGNVTFATCLNNPEYQQGYSGIGHRDPFVVTCFKTADGWVGKVKASNTPDTFDYVIWRVA